jgi:hypothetical protein
MATKRGHGAGQQPSRPSAPTLSPTSQSRSPFTSLDTPIRMTPRRVALLTGGVLAFWFMVDRSLWQCVPVVAPLPAIAVPLSDNVAGFRRGASGAGGLRGEEAPAAQPRQGV